MLSGPFAVAWVLDIHRSFEWLKMLDFDERSSLRSSAFFLRLCTAVV